MAVSGRPDRAAMTEARIVARWRRSPANELYGYVPMAITGAPAEPVLEQPPVDLDALALVAIA